MNYAKVLTNEAMPQYRFIKPTIDAMNGEFNRYIAAMKEIPWWYNERAVLGFYISGLLRNGENIVLQEYSCEKGKNAKDKGRADLLFKYNNEIYLTESKLCWTSINTSGDFKRAGKWALRVLRQAEKYAINEKGIKKGNVFSLCFEVIYCKNCSDKYRTLLKDGWINSKSALRHLDFYTLIVIENKQIKFHEGDYAYPAIAIYGIFDKKAYEK